MSQLVLSVMGLIIMTQNLQIKGNANVALAIKKFKLFANYAILTSQVVNIVVIWILVLNVTRPNFLSKHQMQTTNVTAWQFTI